MAEQETNHSLYYERVKKWYPSRWSAAVVRLAVKQGWITQEECDEILNGEQSA